MVAFVYEDDVIPASFDLLRQLEVVPIGRHLERRVAKLGEQGRLLAWGRRDGRSILGGDGQDWGPEQHRDERDTVHDTAHE